MHAMYWWNWIACFFAGAFLTNAVPHFMQGVSGEPFPTPFAKPPGQGLSSPTVNVVWGLVNLAAGYALFHAGNVAGGGDVAMIVLFAGIAAISIPMSAHFQKKHAK